MNVMTVNNNNNNRQYAHIYETRYYNVLCWLVLCIMPLNRWSSASLSASLIRRVV